MKERAVDMLREEASKMKYIASYFKERDLDSFTKEDLHKWIPIILEQFADFKISVSDIFERLEQIHPNIKFEPEERTIIIAPSNKKEEPLNIENPPFDLNFWAGQEDL